MKIRIFLLASLFASVLANAQTMGGGRGGMQGGAGMGQTGRFYGKVVDSASGKPIDAVSIQLMASKFDMVKKQRKDTMITGMLTPANGNFTLENIPLMGDYTLRITAIGYKQVDKKVSFFTLAQQKQLMEAFAAAAAAQNAAKNDTGNKGKSAPPPNMMETLKKIFGGDMSQMAALADKDLGNILLHPDAKMLENVTVTGSKPMMQLGIDRKIFNVDKNLAASGSSAIDIMRQIPSVNVDIDGNVSVRNSSPTLFVDGRPTTLTIEQIPADEIASVELITNPSAKYDASGGGASILNIVLKKSKRIGYNGSLRAGIDSRGRPNAGGDISLRQNKVNVFASGNFNMRKSLSWSDINTAYKGSGGAPPSVIAQDIENTSGGMFGFGRAGVDYFIDNRNTLTLAGNLMRGSFEGDEENTMRYDTFYNPVKSEKGIRETDFDRNFKNMGSSLSYKHLFAKPGHELTADLNFNRMSSYGTSDYSNQMYDQNNLPKSNPALQITHSTSKSHFFVGQTDYTNRIFKDIKFETGVRAQIRNFDASNDNLVYNYNNMEYDLLPTIAGNYEFTDRVYAAYTTFTGKLGKEGKLGYNLGLRAESSNYDGRLVSIDSSFNVDYPISLFPSAFLSYKLSEKSDMQFNYSRRINRPNFFQLIPFIDYTDQLNLQVGNPGLNPEFTNSLEANYSTQFNNNHTLLASAYYKYTTGLITRYQFKGLNPISKDSSIYNTYINANSSTSYGLELTSTNKFSKKFEMVTNFNLYNATIDSKNINPALSNDQTSFFVKTTLTQRLGKNNQWTLQMNADYQSKTVLPVGGGGRMMGGGGGMFGGNQAAGSNGHVNPNYGADFSIRRDIIKNKTGQGYAGSITLSMNDIFRTRIYDATTSSDFFVQNLSRRRDPQVARLQFNWRFGKMDASIFKRKNMKGETEGMTEGMGGM
ncbi:MAG TPA: TonB-dependent receptor [Phnomibacter sp.]|nr:TonB-dependent receptor [Phnomibacter sp.]